MGACLRAALHGPPVRSRPHAAACRAPHRPPFALRRSPTKHTPAPQTTATEAHVRQALELFKTSTMDAVKSGLMDVAVFTDEQR